MKAWDFTKQSLVCFLLIVLSSFAAAYSGLNVLGRLAFILVGLAYLLHPVAPVNIQIQWGARAKWFAWLLGGCFALYGLLGSF